MKTRDTDNAEKDVRKASQLAPSDVAIRKQLQKVAAEKKRQNQKQVCFICCVVCLLCLLLLDVMLSHCVASGQDVQGLGSGKLFVFVSF